MESPIKKSMAYGKGLTPKGVAGLTGKGGSKDMAPKKFAVKKGGEMFKEAPTSRAIGKHSDQSSGQSMPTKGSDDNKKRYGGIAQSESNSMLGGERPTKFIC